MMTETIVPGSKVLVLDAYSNAIAQKVVASVESGGIRVKDRFELIPFGRVFGTYTDAVAAMIGRAGDNVRVKERELANAKRALFQLERKHAAVTAPSATPPARGTGELNV